MDDNLLSKAFPFLKEDSEYKITSKKDINYNCIAWAAIYDDRWLWPPHGAIHLDGVYNVWPKNIPENNDIETFIELFKTFGYDVCENSNYEEGFRKVALYVKPGTNLCTHAARQKRGGIWTSKLGKENDISHSSPESVEGPVYGKVAYILKKRN